MSVTSAVWNVLPYSIVCLKFTIKKKKQKKKHWLSLSADSARGPPGSKIRQYSIGGNQGTTVSPCPTGSLVKRVRKYSRDGQPKSYDAIVLLLVLNLNLI